MNYPLENLDPERFQHLCQTLLVAAEPNISCFPVGMPDGGRDATQMTFNEEDEGFVIYQVKFSRTLKEGSSAREWAMEMADGEVEKVSRLKVKGAKRYIFITNVQGTSHLDVGSMDRLRTQLEEKFQMPVACWWRDDICRRLDGNWSIKLRYPEVLSGQDFLRLLIEQKNDESKTRRLNAMRAFLADQYKEDQEVKFKQVELQNKILDLFVDLPFKVVIENGRQFVKDKGPISFDASIHVSEREKAWVLSDESGIGTASLLLNEKAGILLQQIVIEGAPGQGKSTLAQYLCQVHRIRLLGKQSDLQLLPEDHRLSPIYIPFKVDLRDLSEWLSGVDPFTKSPLQKDALERTVEAFLARLVAHKAGGIAFDVNDLIEISKISPLFIAFDGLDEVADIRRRSEVVNGVSKTLLRLQENCSSLKSIITSRPAAFANSPGFEHSLFPYLQLGSVTRDQIQLYSSKWLAARALTDKERAEFEKILEEKLDQPHLRDLSKNPMQLTILLSLILTKGSALPDKRTALYDSYIELFFGRESSKNPIVRENIDLLKDIHRYLAWVLHSRAEGGRGSGTDGRLSTEEMKSVLQAYLKREGQRTEIIDDIFNAMLERVVMIVSRIEGTHEFEVQPLREYFAARYLYDTAPYSPTGEEKSGTKPDRFDAIARNPFWLNVVRFFCGCFSKGELLDLGDRVKNLLQDGDIGRTRRPTLLAAMLLQDWVFSQSPRAINEVTVSLLNKNSIRKLIPSDGGFRNEESLRIPSNCGGSQIVSKALDYMLDKDINEDLMDRLARFVCANQSSELIDQMWLMAKPVSDKDFDRWLKAGLYLDSLDRLSLEEVHGIIEGRALMESSIDLFWRAGQEAAVAASGPTNARLCDKYLFSIPSFWPNRKPGAPYFLMPFFYGILRQGRYGSYGRKEFQEQLIEECRKFSAQKFDENINPHLLGIAKKCFLASISVSREISQEPEITEPIKVWELIANTCGSVFGDVPMAIALGMTVCSVSSKRGRARKVDLFNVGEPLVDRLRYAKLQSRKPNWWRDVFQVAATDEQKILSLGILWAWCPTDYIVDYGDEISAALESLSIAQWQQIASLQLLGTGGPRSEGKPVNTLPFKNKSLRFAYLFAHREAAKFGAEIFMTRFLTGSSLDFHPSVAYFKIHHASQAVKNKAIDWPTFLGVMKSVRGFQSGGIINIKEMPSEVIDEILQKPEFYPASLWDRAQEEIASHLAKSIKPVAYTAKKDKWFLD